jgi:alpha-L-arabinofuranosidase
MQKIQNAIIIIVCCVLIPAIYGADRKTTTTYHVSVTGNDSNDGMEETPLKTISAAAEKALPGDTITIHEGVYRERINPPRGGTANEQRIVYQAAPGEDVVIKGSEVITGWEKVEHETWRVVLENEFFGDFNPYQEPISGPWFNRNERDTHPGAVYLNEHWLTEAAARQEVLQPVEGPPLWFAEVDDENTTILAQFEGVDPNRENVEINVRQSVFYPEKTGINYLTVRGFTMEQAATPWAPPTAEQVGLIGTHWSKGWIIENNTIRYSACVGITLGKYGDEFDNTHDYNKTIQRALANGWSKGNIGHHIVSNNHIYYCEQAGIAGSLGAVFSTITGNEIHDIHIRRLFNGAEMAGIKIHAAIDMVIRDNHVYRTNRGIWLDWMAQGARITGNLLHDNAANSNLWSRWGGHCLGGEEDMFLEVNHGPIVVDNNIMLSPTAIKDRSQGVLFAHNLVTGQYLQYPDFRETPYHKPHSTDVVALHDIASGDKYYYNNLFAGRFSLRNVERTELPVRMHGNVFVDSAAPSTREPNPLVQLDFDPELGITDKADGVYLHIAFNKEWVEHKGRLVTSEKLANPIIPDVPYENPDGTPFRINTDYFGQTRERGPVYPGPFKEGQEGQQIIKVWPKE